MSLQIPSIVDYIMQVIRRYVCTGC